MEDRNLSLTEVAGLLGVSERTVRRWIKAGNLRAYKPGRDYRIPERAVRELVEGSEVSPKVRGVRGRSSLEPSFNDVLKEAERHVPALRRLTALVTRFADRWEEEIAKRGQAAESNLDWAIEVSKTATDTTLEASEELEVALGVSTSPEALDLFRELERLDAVISRTSSWFDTRSEDAPADLEAYRKQRGERLRELQAIA